MRRATYFVHYRLAWRYRWNKYLKQCRKADFFRRRVLFRLATKAMADWAIQMAIKRGEEAEAVK
jgi:hypothetical protein